MQIPRTPLSKEAVLAAVEAARRDDVPWREGKLYAYVFDGGADVEEVGKKAYAAYLSENGLDPTTFPSLLAFENDLVDMARRHLGGDDRVVGNFTSGGTESILLAVKTARDAFRAKRPGVRPEMIVPVSAHAAFHKAAHYLDVDLVVSTIDPDTYRADVADMRAKISDRTMLLVGSACSYAQGVVDPIREIAALALEKNVLCHVDGCMGGFLLPYFRRLGASVPDFDFRVPGVTSMSMDLHKYGLTPKGASLVLYANESLRRHQIFACSSWTGYTMINNTVQSSKSGGPMAAAWAVLQFVGDEGRVTVIDFVDFECPFCRMTHAELAPIVKEKKLHVVRKQVPLRMHKHAMDAAKAACCGEKLGQGDAMADALMAAPPSELTPEGCAKMAKDLGLDAKAFEDCLNDPATVAQIEKDKQTFKDARGHGLPLLFVGTHRLEGAQEGADLRAAVAEAEREL